MERFFFGNEGDIVERIEDIQAYPYPPGHHGKILSTGNTGNRNVTISESADYESQKISGFKVSREVSGIRNSEIK
jgi:hypothetical protein